MLERPYFASDLLASEVDKRGPASAVVAHKRVFQAESRPEWLNPGGPFILGHPSSLDVETLKIISKSSI